MRRMTEMRRAKLARDADGSNQPGDRTPALTGFDAPMDEAETGSEGNGASPWGADMSGLGLLPGSEPYEDDFRWEPDPSRPADIAADHVVDGDGRHQHLDADQDDEDYDEEITARPRGPARPISPEFLSLNEE